jgi:hypothetical protein
VKHEIVMLAGTVSDFDGKGLVGLISADHGRSVGTGE